MSFGAVLKDVRAAKGLSQAELAHCLGSTQRHVSFVETGRTRATAYFIARICRELSLSLAQKSALYIAAGLPTPFAKRNRSSEEVTAALDLIETRVLNNWPFPALVLDEDWNVLRYNSSFFALFGPLLSTGNTSPNLLDVMLSEELRGLIANWEEAATSFYFRLQSAAAHSPLVAEKLENARDRGLFDSVETQLLQSETLPIFVPIRLIMPGGIEIEMSSLIGKLASVQDALIDGFDIELMVPVNAASEAVMRIG
jgi:transcriptional regulator with XRE-family HTH domain